MAGKPLVLVAAPQRAVRLLAAAALRPAGFRVAHSAGSLPTPDELADLRPDVIVLEVDDQPGRAASTVRDVADWSRAPILLVSSHATSSQVAAVLDAGADDHLARPFDPAEFIARVRALVRRQGGGINAGTVAVGRSLVDLERRTVSRAGTLRELTRAEWALLTTLIRKRGAIVLREELLAAAFGEAAHDDPALLRVLASRLRRKLGSDPWDEGMIRTVHGDRICVRSGSGSASARSDPPAAVEHQAGARAPVARTVPSPWVTGDRVDVEARGEARRAGSGAVARLFSPLAPIDVLDRLLAARRLVAPLPWSIAIRKTSRLLSVMASASRWNSGLRSAAGPAPDLHVMEVVDRLEDFARTHPTARASGQPGAARAPWTSHR